MNLKSLPGLQDTEEGSDFGTIGGAVYATFAPWVVWNPGGNPSGTLASLGSAPASGQINPGSAVAVTTGGIIFNLLFDAAAMAAPQSFRDGIQQAASILSGAISDHITVNLIIDYSGTGGGAAAGPDHGIYQTYTSVRTNLINGATPGDTSFNSLPAGTSIQGQSSVAVWNAQLKLWGIIGANDTTTDDGSATFATDINPSLLVGVALHELTHAIGRVPYGPPYDSPPDIFDLFRYTSPGTRLIAGGNTAPAAYFSVDGGVTKIADYGRTSDPSDFLNSGVQGSTDPFNEFYNGATAQFLTPIDLRQLDVLGFHLVGAPVNHAPVVTIPSTNVSASAGQVFAASSLFSATDADNDTLSYYLYDGTSAATSGHFVVNGTVVPAGTVYTITAAQLAQTTFVAGAASTSDDLYAMATDGQLNSNNNVFSPFHVNVTNVNHAPVLTVASANVAATAGQTFSAASLFSASDPDGDAISYYLYDGTSAANSGHFVVNGTVVPAATVYSITAAQLAQTTFVAGAILTSDDLYAMATDGQLNSNNNVFSPFHVNVGSSTGPASSTTPAGDNFVFASDLGLKTATDFIQGGAADNYTFHVEPNADFNKAFGIGDVAPVDGAHPGAAADILALFGMHVAGHAIDHFVF